VQTAGNGGSELLIFERRAANCHDRGDARPVRLPTCRQLRALPVGPPYTIAVLCHDSPCQNPPCDDRDRDGGKHAPVAGSRNVAMSSPF
jgi:hypothetical protein